MQWIAWTYLILISLASVATFFAYGVDKRQASKGGNRISEKSLHILALIGGWPGALLGQRVFRHKTVKMSFRIILWLIIGLHIAMIVMAILNWR